jgi:hypothetical protein
LVASIQVFSHGGSSASYPSSRPESKWTFYTHDRADNLLYLNRRIFPHAVIAFGHQHAGASVNAYHPMNPRAIARHHHHIPHLNLF